MLSFIVAIAFSRNPVTTLRFNTFVSIEIPFGILEFDAGSILSLSESIESLFGI